MDASTALKTRRSVRRYESRAIPHEVLTDIVDCGRLAATAINIQPWEFIVVTERERLCKIAEMTDYGKFIADCGACIVVLCKETKYYLEDGCAATQNILVAARAHGLGSCWVAGDKKGYCEKMLAYLEAPTGIKLVSVLALGYTSEEPKPKKRELKEVLHWESY